MPGQLAIFANLFKVYGGQVVRRARLRSGLTQEQLAQRVGTTASAVSRWEHAKAEPGYATVERCVAACDLTLPAVLREADVDPHDSSLLDACLALSIDERAERLIHFVRVVQAGRAAAAELL